MGQNPFCIVILHDDAFRIWAKEWECFYGSAAARVLFTLAEAAEYKMKMVASRFLERAIEFLVFFGCFG